jgi:hypothetical protein
MRTQYTHSAKSDTAHKWLLHSTAHRESPRPTPVLFCPGNSYMKLDHCTRHDTDDTEALFAPCLPNIRVDMLPVIHLRLNHNFRTTQNVQNSQYL